MTAVAADLHDLLVGVRRSVRSHHRRRRFFDNLYRSKTALTLLAGSATMGTILASMPQALQSIAAALVIVIPTLKLVLGATTKARLHADLARRFLDLERAMTLAKDPTDDDLRLWTAQRLLIEAEEPPILRVLDILCHNALLLALDYPRAELCDVPWWKRWLAPFMNVADEGIRKIGERVAPPA
jgi:hypothetical protein